VTGPSAARRRARPPTRRWRNHGALEARAGESPIAQAPVGGVDLGDAVTARAMDLDLEAERGSPAKRGEGKCM
jgi:hypothetical protein